VHLSVCLSADTQKNFQQISINIAEVLGMAKERTDSIFTRDSGMLHASYVYGLSRVCPSDCHTLEPYQNGES